ncbi:aldo/keto reductase [Pseudomonas sp. MDMC_285]|nr:aldo/keto reductase [Pseudomonas sp. MDMC_285]
MVWSPLGWGRLTGKIRRGKPIGDGRIATGGGEAGPPVDNERLYSVVEALDEIALARGKSIPQVALNWVLSRPSVANVVIGARDEAQLLDNLGALDWSLSPEESARLDAVSRETPIYPYWHQMGFDERNPKATSW